MSGAGYCCYERPRLAANPACVTYASAETVGRAGRTEALPIPIDRVDALEALALALGAAAA